MIVNFRQDFSEDFIKDLLFHGVRAFQINGKCFNFKEYKKIAEDLKNIFLEKDEIPSIIFQFKGHDILVTKVENIIKKKNFSEGQIIKIKYDDSKNKNEKEKEKENIIYIDKKISNFLNEGDIIQFSDSTLLLKIISVEKHTKNKIQKYKNLLNAMNENENKKIKK